MREEINMPTGWIVILLLLLPNAFFLLLKPRYVPPETDGQREFKVQVLETVEKLGQVGCFIIPIFYSFRFELPAELISFVVFFGLMAFYYSGWIRYIATGRQFRMLFAPMAGIPIPMAVAPVLAVLVIALNFHSWLLALAAVILGAGHIPVSWLEWQRCLEMNAENPR